MNAIGIDLGATWIRGVVLGLDGTVGQSLRIPTPDGPQTAGEILYSIWKQLGQSDLVAVAAAPEFDNDRVIRRWPNRPEYVGASILDLLQANGVTPLLLDDASAAVAAEHISATQGDSLPSTTSYISVGTGVGAGLVIKDQLWLGTRGGAMDLGHVPVPAGRDMPCRCGQTGCLQSVASGRQLKTISEKLGILPDKVIDLAAGGNTEAIGIVNSTAVALAQGILIVEKLIQPDRFILGGGLMRATFMTDCVTAEAQKIQITTPISRAKWGDLGGAIGACAELYRRMGLALKSLREYSNRTKYRFALIQGPNLNLLGEREPEFYGTLTLKEIEHKLTTLAHELGCHLYCVQSNRESDLVEWLQHRLGRLDGAIVNPAALTAHGYALRDALTARGTPFFEVHLSKIDQRESWHQDSCFASIAVDRISGLGVDGYQLALRGLIEYLSKGVDQ